MTVLFVLLGRSVTAEGRHRADERIGAGHGKSTSSAEHEKRSAAAKKGWETRRRRHR
jgi:hypothetical protein